MSRTLVLLRHGQTASNREKRIQGQLDVDLDDGWVCIDAQTRLERLLKGEQPMWTTDLIVVSRNAHDRAALSAFGIELIKRAANNLAVTPRLHLLHHIGNSVVEF